MTERLPHSPCRRTDRHDAHDFEVYHRPFWCPGFFPAPVPPANLSAKTPREQLLAAIDGTRVPPLGYGSPAELLAAYDASVLPGRAEYDALVADADRLRRDGVALHARAEAVDEQLAVLRRQVVAPVDPAALVLACASFVRDTYSGEWADDAAATLEADADRIERGEPCSLLRLAAVLPATTRHDTDDVAARTLASLEKVTERARRAEAEVKRLRADRTAVLREAADFFERVLNESLDPDSDPRYCTAVRDVVMGLRRMADETAATETQQDGGAV
ncbi:hypothetical protein [Streptomyces olivaceus]|uniref:hypothetical protein n=1 Tax=Streptomyces olivaceus TaxID=47716 RepID=UPI001CCB113A|nr:hypothetical protein [Streptomyces olivaceus]MBZ6135744.1 hypothetical protein [Streptomyces olivaceus]